MLDWVRNEVWSARYNSYSAGERNAALVLASPLVMPATEAPQALFASVIAPGVSVMASDWYWAPIAALSVPACSCEPSLCGS